MTSTRRIRPILSLTLSLLLILWFAAAVTSPAMAQGTTNPSRITQAIDEGKTIQLSRNTRPEANANNDRGPVSDAWNADHVLLVLQRSPAQERKVEKFIDQLNDRNSPNFHKWLTAEEFGEKFGVAEQDVKTVTNWLESHGFTINQAYSSRMLIDFSGTAGQIREAFHTSIHQLDVNGKMHFANMSDPMIPDALAPVVKGIASLHDFMPHPMYKVKPDYTFAGCTSSADFPTEPGSCYAITPQDDAVIYSLNPLWAAGFTGAGQTIAVVEDTDTYDTTGATSEWTEFRSNFGLSGYPGTYTEVHPGCTDPSYNADDGEAAIDVEMATAFAPGAAVELISCAGGSVTFGGQIALANLLTTCGTSCPGVVSVSYGVCEAVNGNGGNQLFFNTYEQAAAQGVSVFGATGDEGASGCGNEFGVQYALTSLGVSGWTETPYNVAVGGTDFEDVYNAKEASTPLSTYWGSNSSTFGAAKSYIPEIPWNESCASVLISEYVNNTFAPYGSGSTCNKSPYDTTASYLTLGAGSGGASNCATGSAGINTYSYLITQPECQGWPKPTWQSGSSLTGGKAVYGVPNDGVRDIPDVSLFASSGVWGHYQTVCWNDPSQTSAGATANCTGAPSTWSGFGGTSVASPAMAGIQAIVNQKTAENWGNPNPIYYQIAQNEYGTRGGSFLGSSCNSSGSGGPASGCAFNDVTQGDIDLACEYNGTLEDAHCYPGGLSPTYNSGIYGVASTDVVTGATVLWGGSGYTSAPTCVIAGPSNVNPYKSPTGTTLYAGGSQATCTATISASSATTTAVWTIIVESTSSATDKLYLTNVPLGGS
ncbi:MAG: protease pro-enzyme activation domain-containing protein, partial [Terriglobales bacterium]